MLGKSLDSLAEVSIRTLEDIATHNRADSQRHI
jgi:hypothetical protein